MFIERIDDLMGIEQTQLRQALDHRVEAGAFGEAHFAVCGGDQSTGRGDRLEKRPLPVTLQFLAKSVEQSGSLGGEHKRISGGFLHAGYRTPTMALLHGNTRGITRALFDHRAAVAQG